MSKVLQNRLQRIKLIIEKGYTGNIETGEVYDWKGKLITLKDKGYVILSFKHNGKVINLRAHQFIWYLATGEVVEHIDHKCGIKDDNRISQLRSVTNQENAFNTKARGYCWNKASQKWLARIMINGKPIHLGRFINEEDARNTYIAAKEKYHTINK